MFKEINILLNKKRRGNTLSETLIAIVIVGIVFTLSTGIMVADYNRNQTVVRLQKLYSTLAQAFDSAIAKEGQPSTWAVSNEVSEQSSKEFFDTYLKPNLMIARYCDDDNDNTCKYDFKELNGNPKVLSNNWIRFFLNDGAFVAMQTVSNDNYKVIYFYVDTNGKKRLNVVARDIFIMEYWIQNDQHPNFVGKVRMYGEEYSRSQLISESGVNNCNRIKNGNYCGALIKNDGWQIKDGYPWAQARYVVQ